MYPIKEISMNFLINNAFIINRKIMEYLCIINTVTGNIYTLLRCNIIERHNKLDIGGKYWWKAF